MTIDKFRGKFHFLSNFSPSFIKMRGREYATAENAYQAAKTLDLELRRPFETCYPGQAKKMGRKLPLRPDWNDIKDDVMHRIVMHKFTRHPELGELLIATAPHELIEGNNWGDRYWGICNGVGQNKLGLILMEVREYLMEV
jgi:hypothetical protein